MEKSNEHEAYFHEQQPGDVVHIFLHDNKVLTGTLLP